MIRQKYTSWKARQQFHSRKSSAIFLLGSKEKKKRGYIGLLAFQLWKRLWRAFHLEFVAMQLLQCRNPVVITFFFFKVKSLFCFLTFKKLFCFSVSLWNRCKYLKITLETISVIIRTPSCKSFPRLLLQEAVTRGLSTLTSYNRTGILCLLYYHSLTSGLHFSKNLKPKPWNESLFSCNDFSC